MIIGLVIATFILSIKTGILLGSSKMSKRGMTVYAALSGVIFISLCIMMKDYCRIVTGLIDRYTFIAGCMTGVFFIFAGYRYDESEGEKSKIPFLAYLPCPFCAAALIVSVIYTSEKSGLPLYVSVISTGLFSSLLVLSSGMIMKVISESSNVKLTGIFNKLLSILGVFTLLCALILPNITANMQGGYIPPITGSIENLILSTAGFAILFVIGLLKAFITSHNNVRRTI